MRQQRTLQTTMAGTMYNVGTGLPTSGYALIVDGRAKADFKTHEDVLKAATDLKRRFPMLQIKVYDAEKNQSEKIELAVA
jgi:hypothetical protein